MKENRLRATGTAIDLIARQDWLERAAGAAQPAVIRAFKAGGRTGRKVKNFLHGAWFGHPLHPALIDVPLGAWTVAFVFDLMAGKNGRKDYARASDAAVTIGLAGAAGACSTGHRLSPSRASRRASAMGKLKCARLGADPWSFKRCVRAPDNAWRGLAGRVSLPMLGFMARFGLLIHTIHYRSPAHLRDELRRYGVTL